MNLYKLLKYNPNHDEKGRFSTSESATFVSTTNPKAVAAMQAAHASSKPKVGGNGTFHTEAGQWTHPSSGEKRIYLNNHSAARGDKVYIVEQKKDEWGMDWTAKIKQEHFGTTSVASIRAGSNKPADIAVQAADDHVTKHGFDARKVKFKELWDSAKPQKSAKSERVLNLFKLFKIKRTAKTRNDEATNKYLTRTSKAFDEYLKAIAQIALAQWDDTQARKSRALGALQKADSEADAASAQVDSMVLIDATGAAVAPLIDELKLIYEEALTQAALDIGFKIDIAAASEDALKWAETHGAELVGMTKDGAGGWIENPNPKWSITKTTREELRRTVLSAIEEGKTNQQVGEEIMNSQAFDSNRADMIARTEIVIAHTEGNIQSWKDSDVVAGMKWSTAKNEMVCPICALNDGAVADFGKPFPSGHLKSPAHPRCRCDMQAVLK